MTIELVSPTRKSAHLLLLVRERLSRVELIEPVNYLALRANNIVPLAPTNSDLYQNDDAHDQGCDWKTLIERLRARLGEEAVRAVSLYPDHRPEKAFRATIGFGGDTECLLFGRRPVWLLESPAALKATDGIPSFTDQLHLLQGPERIQSGWWDSGKIARDYYVAETPSGERFWIYRDLFNDGRWFLHGLFS